MSPTEALEYGQSFAGPYRLASHEAPCGEQPPTAHRPELREWLANYLIADTLTWIGGWDVVQGYLFATYGQQPLSLDGRGVIRTTAASC